MLADGNDADCCDYVIHFCFCKRKRNRRNSNKKKGEYI